MREIGKQRSMSQVWSKITNFTFYNSKASSLGSFAPPFCCHLLTISLIGSLKFSSFWTRILPCWNDCSVSLESKRPTLKLLWRIGALSAHMLDLWCFVNVSWVCRNSSDTGTHPQAWWPTKYHSTPKSSLHKIFLDRHFLQTSSKAGRGNDARLPSWCWFFL